MKTFCLTERRWLLLKHGICTVACFVKCVFSEDMLLYWYTVWRANCQIFWAGFLEWLLFTNITSPPTNVSFFQMNCSNYQSNVNTLPGCCLLSSGVLASTFFHLIGPKGSTCNKKTCVFIFCYGYPAHKLCVSFISSTKTNVIQFGWNHCGHVTNLHFPGWKIYVQNMLKKLTAFIYHVLMSHFQCSWYYVNFQQELKCYQ